LLLVFSTLLPSRQFAFLFVHFFISSPSTTGKYLAMLIGRFSFPFRPLSDWFKIFLDLAAFPLGRKVPFLFRSITSHCVPQRATIIQDPLARSVDAAWPLVVAGQTFPTFLLALFGKTLPPLLDPWIVALHGDKQSHSPPFQALR
jgi:hypothetical protein